MRIEVVRVEIQPITKRNGVEKGYQTIGNPVHSCLTPDGVRHRGEGCVYDAARHMIAHGTDPKTPLRVYRDGQKILTGTVHAFARVTWGGSQVDPQTRVWRPNPMAGPLPPALAAWYETLRA